MRAPHEAHGLLLFAGPVIEKIRGMGKAAQAWTALGLVATAAAGIGFAAASWRGTPARVSALEDSAEAHSARLDSVRVASDTALARILHLSRRFDRHVDSVSVPGLESIQENKDELARVRDQLEGLQARLYGIYTRMDSIAARVNRGNSMLRRLLCRRGGGNAEQCENRVYGGLHADITDGGPP